MFLTFFFRIFFFLFKKKKILFPDFPRPNYLIYAVHINCIPHTCLCMFVTSSVKCATLSFGTNRSFFMLTDPHQVDFHLLLRHTQSDWSYNKAWNNETRQCSVKRSLLIQTNAVISLKYTSRGNQLLVFFCHCLSMTPKDSFICWWKRLINTRIKCRTHLCTHIAEMY